MAKFFDHTNVKAAQQARSERFDLSCDHFTTMDFLSLRPIYVHEMMPNESLKLDLSVFSRLSPMVEPFFGSCRFVNRAFFVPFRTIFEGFNDFLEDVPHQFFGFQNPEFIDNVTNLRHSDLVHMFSNVSNGLSIIAPSSSSRYDFTIIPTRDPEPHILTEKGKKYYNILVSLGYKINFSNTADDCLMSALPLLAYAKVYCDWIVNPAYDSHKVLTKYFIGKRPSLTENDVYLILSNLSQTYYDSDYFTSCWDNPSSPNNGTSSRVKFSDVNNIGDYAFNHNQVDTSDQGGAFGTNAKIISEAGLGSNLRQISQFMIQALHKVDDYIKRKQIAGSRTLDRYRVDYGVQLDSSQLDRSIYIGQCDIPIQISDVMQTAPNSEQGSSGLDGVGDYSGKGIAAGSKSMFKFTYNEFGMIIVCSYIAPKVSYLHGRPRYLQHHTKLDFFRGEFDNLGTQAVRIDELVGNGFNTDEYEHDPAKIFGFLPRYAEYKVATDNLSGDFLLQSKNASLDGWLCYRSFSADDWIQDDPTNAPKHDENFTKANDSWKFSNIWMYNKAGFDHFFCYFHFDVEAYMPCKKLFDWYDFDSLGKEINQQINGTKLS